jgi:hypothetical protein
VLAFSLGQWDENQRWALLSKMSESHAEASLGDSEHLDCSQDELETSAELLRCTLLKAYNHAAQINFSHSPLSFESISTSLNESSDSKGDSSEASQSLKNALHDLSMICEKELKMEQATSGQQEHKAFMYMFLCE